MTHARVYDALVTLNGEVDRAAVKAANGQSFSLIERDIDSIIDFATALKQQVAKARH